MRRAKRAFINAFLREMRIRLEDQVNAPAVMDLESMFSEFFHPYPANFKLSDTKIELILDIKLITGKNKLNIILNRPGTPFSKVLSR